MRVPTPGESVIGGGMSANAQFAKVLAIEEGRNGIRCNCVSPSNTTGTRAYDRVMSRDYSRALSTKAANKAAYPILQQDGCFMVRVPAPPRPRTVRRPAG
jgi:gluconate 5-dehydrogenase/3-oxoacyl-[acyl-carrier protein] reductase